MSSATTPRPAAGSEATPAQRAHLGVIGLAVALPLLLLAVTGRYGLSLMDEGFLWYGAQRVRAGEVPLLDFQSYDIGRYYWSALWMWLAGSDGILPVRAGNAVLASISVALSVGLVRAGAPGARWRLVGAAVLVAVWLVPDYKIADSFAAILLVAGLAGWLARPHDWKRTLACGICIGVASTIGINHALYATIALGLALAWHRWARGETLGLEGLAALAGGAIVGYLPVLICHVFVTGFSSAFADFIRQIFEAGTTNLPLNLPRLTAAFTDRHSGLGDAVRESSLAALLLLAAVLWANGAARAVRRPLEAPATMNPVMCAALIVCVPYAHYALSRLDIIHVAVGVPPLIIAVMTQPGAGFGAAAARIGLLCVAVASAALLPPEHRGYRAVRGVPHPTVDLHGERLHVAADTAVELSWLGGLTQTYASGDRTFFAAPYWPGAYAAMRRPSPTWEIYALFPSPAYRQQREIERLATTPVGFAVVFQWSIDGRDDLGFARTHPLVADYLRNCFSRLQTASAAPMSALMYIAPPQRSGTLQNVSQTQDPPCHPTARQTPPPG